MQSYIHDENIAHYQKLVAASELDPSRDEVLLKLLAEEKTKDNADLGHDPLKSDKASGWLKGELQPPK